MGVSMVLPNFPVADVKAATDFYVGLGFSVNPMFSDENTSCIVVNEQVAVMLLQTERFQGFLPEGAEAILGGNRHESTTTLLLGSNEEVDEITAKAEAGGGKIHRPAEANEFGMYGSAFDDLDGHLWEVFYMAAPDA